jgi:transposase-like protein
MVTAQEGKKVRRIFTAEQKFEILKNIERCKRIKEGLAKHDLAQSVYHKWKPAVKAGRSQAVGSRESQLKEVVLNQALVISE